MGKKSRRRRDGKLARVLLWAQLAAALVDMVWSVVDAARTMLS